MTKYEQRYVFAMGNVEVGKGRRERRWEIGDKHRVGVYGKE
jgi:hypothetical protein